MSLRYKGAVISATPPTTTGGNTGTASGAWTLQQQMQAQGAGNWPTAPIPAYIEDWFTTYLYVGDGGNQNIVNGRNFTTYGGLCWVKNRTTSSEHQLSDTARGNGAILSSEQTAAQVTGGSLESLNSNGFSVKNGINTNSSGEKYVSWSFLEKEKFFDVVTYTGSGSSRDISHNLGSAPGCIIIKAYSGTGASSQGWPVYHRILGAGNEVFLNTTAAYTSNTYFTANPTSTIFSVSGDDPVNKSGVLYVAYLFAHNAGGFGANGTDNVITCGGFSGSATVNLGYEPQWVLTKRSDSTGSWYLIDNMRGFTAPDGASGNNSNYLFANTTAAESSYNLFSTTSTGFSATGATGSYIYIAIRRGPMKTPTTGTSVFSPVLGANTSTGALIYNTGFPVDMLMQGYQAGGANNAVTVDRLRGSPFLSTSLTDTEATPTYVRGFASNSGVVAVSGFDYTNIVGWNFRRAPGFFDEVCYTGTGSARTVNHNLGVVPEMMIVKCRSSSGYQWSTYVSSLGNTKSLYLNLNLSAQNATTEWNSTSPTSSVFTVGTSIGVNESSQTYVAYLFATVAGVSKVGSYTGTGTTNQINCGFTGGARFVLIKRTDSTGDWYVWDSARGIVAGNDPYLLLNSTAAEVTNTDYVDTYSAGFEISSTAPSGINANGGSFIFLAIA